MSADEQILSESGAPDAPPVPPVPRPATRRASRRSWAEMPVRIWMILTIAVLLVTAYFTGTRVYEALNDRWLIANGVDVVAKLGRTGGNMVPKRQFRTGTIDSSLIFILNGQPQKFDIKLPPKPGSYAMEGMDFPIKVDPNDPMRWTEETEPKPWSQELTAVGFLAPILAIALIVMIWKRLAVLRIWKREPLAPATVVEVRQTAVAPLSRVIRFTLDDSDDRRVWSTLMPTAAGIPEKGQTLWLICPPRNPNRSIVAQLYA